MSAASAPYRVAIVGTGGVGALFAARLAASPGMEVHCVCRPPHIDVIRELGISVTGISGATAHPVRVASCSPNPADVGVCDLVVVCLKTVHLEEAALDLRPLVGPRTLVLPTQNGVDTPGRLAQMLGAAEQVLGGYTRVTSLLTAPGAVSHVAVNPVLQGAGLLPSTGAWAAEELQRCSAAFERCPHIKLCVEADIQLGMWRKLIILATFSTVCCVSRCPLGPLMEAEGSRSTIQQCMRECAAVAKACGSEMSDADLESCFAQLQRLPYGCTPSLMRDYVGGHPSELHSQTGAVVRLGRQHGVPTPLLSAMYALLLPNELRNRGELAWPDITDEVPPASGLGA